MNPNPDLDPELETLLQTLRRVAPRDPQPAARARHNFLAEAAKMTPAVSFAPRNRLDEWKAKLKSIQHKEKSPMFNLMMTLVLAFGAIFGSGATVVAAAQNALPDAPLYPVKAWSEDLRLGWEADPQAQFDLALQFTARRVAEIQAMLADGEIVPEPFVARFEYQQRHALQFAASLPAEPAQAAFEQIRDQAQQQTQAMQQLNLTDPACEQLRDRLQTMLQTQAQAAQTGLDDPDQLRDQLRLRDRLHLETPTLVPSETTETTEITPVGDNPWTDGTPTPGSSYGPGESQNPWTDETPIPGSGYGPGESRNPWTDETPIPDSSYGPGPGNCTDCVPQPQNNQPVEPPQPQPGNDNETDPNPAPQPENGSGDPVVTSEPGGGNGGKP